MSVFDDFLCFLLGFIDSAIFAQIYFGYCTTFLANHLFQRNGSNTKKVLAEKSRFNKSTSSFQSTSNFFDERRWLFFTF